MNYSQFYNNISPCYLYLEGEDSFLRDIAVKKVKSEYNIDDIDAVTLENPNVSLLLTEIATIPFISEKRLVLVKEFYPSERDFSLLADALKRLSGTVVFIVSNSEKCEEFNSELITKVNCNKDEVFASDYIYGYFTKEGLSIGQEALNAIIDYCLCDMSRIDGEIKKLSSFCMGKKSHQLFRIFLSVILSGNQTVFVAHSPSRLFKVEITGL